MTESMKRRSLSRLLLLAGALFATACGGAASTADTAVAAPETLTLTPALPGHRVVGDAQLQIHGADLATIQRAHEEATFAIEKFRSFTGTQSRPVAIVVFDSPRELETFDHRRFRKEGAIYFPWVSENYVRLASRSIRVVEALAVVLRNADEGVSVLSPLPVEEPADFAFEAGDVLLGLDGKPIQDAADFAERFGALGQGAQVDIAYRRGTQEHVARFAKSTPADEDPGASPMGDEIAERVADARPLSHEVCHILLISHASELKGRKMMHTGASQIPGGDYGHPDLPDWFDESVATLCEYPGLQASRRKTLRAEFEAHIPLSELFTMEHPAIAAQSEMQAQMDQQASGGDGDGAQVVVMVSADDDDDDPDAQRESLFYAQALAVGEFLVDRQGPAIIGELTEGFIQGRSVGEILKEADGVPADSAALESEWTAWVRGRGEEP